MNILVMTSRPVTLCINMSEPGLFWAVSSYSSAIEDLSTSLNMKTPAVRLDNDDLSQYEDASC